MKRGLAWFTLGALSSAAGYVAVIVLSVTAQSRHLATTYPVPAGDVE